MENKTTSISPGRIVAAHADGPYLSLGFQPLRDFDDFMIEYRVKVFFGIHVMYHTDVEIIGAQLFQKRFERGYGLLGVTGTQVLVVFPCGT